NFTFLFPLLYLSDGDFWTPLVMKLDDIKGIGAFIPLIFKDELEDTFWYPFPFARHWASDDGAWGNQLFPLWYYSHENDNDKHFNLAGIVADYQRMSADHTRFKYLMPLGTIE